MYDVDRAAAASGCTVLFDFHYNVHSNLIFLLFHSIQNYYIYIHSEASKGSLDQECLVENTTPECLDYGRFLDELVTVRDAMAESKQKVSLVDALQAIRINAADGVKVKSSPELTQALTAAKQATSEFGVTSVEARLAWETYEEIASAGYENTVGVVSLLEECSVEAGAEACKAIEELQRVMPILMSLEMAK
jgi:hypothetical protein